MNSRSLRSKNKELNDSESGKIGLRETQFNTRRSMLSKIKNNSVETLGSELTKTSHLMSVKRSKRCLETSPVESQTNVESEDSSYYPLNSKKPPPKRSRNSSYASDESSVRMLGSTSNAGTSSEYKDICTNRSNLNNELFFEASKSAGENVLMAAMSKKRSTEGSSKSNQADVSKQFLTNNPFNLETNEELYKDGKENVHEFHDIDSEMEHGESKYYQKVRELNLKANEDFLARIGLSKASDVFQQSPLKKILPSKRGLQVAKEVPDPVSRRYSLRLRHMDPLGKLMPEPEEPEAVEVPSRLPPGPLSLNECVYNKNEDDSQKSLQKMCSLVCSQDIDSSNVLKVTKNNFMTGLEQANINDRRVAKVVPGRIFSIAWHPSAQRLISVAGDRDGYIGLWDVTASDSTGQDHVTVVRPHLKPVNELLFSPSDSHKLFSCSYDATLRCCDFENQVISEIFSVPEEKDDLFRNFCFIDNANTMLVSHFSGNVSLVDTRTAGTAAEQVHAVSKKSLRTISVHPTKSHYFITAGLDNVIALWDLRFISKSKKPIQVLQEHTKAINSAYFSPTGHSVLSCSNDDTINLYTVSPDVKLDLFKRIRHNNYTGRWLTKFRPNWHPSVENVFVSGSMQKPRQVEVFSAETGSLLKALINQDHLCSVCSLNAFHPNLASALVGGNSSGRLHVFM